MTGGNDEDRWAALARERESEWAALDAAAEAEEYARFSASWVHAGGDPEDIGPAWSEGFGVEL